MKKILYLCGLLLLLCSTTSLFAQNSRGKDFWLMFNSNELGSGTLTLSLFITGDVNTTGTVTIPGIAFSQNYTVTAGAVTTVVLPAAAHITSSNVIENKAIHVTSVDNVVVYGLNRVQYTTDAFLGIPTNSLGLEHLILTYYTNLASAPSQFGVVASQDNTVITITPSQNATSHLAGVPYTITLNKNQAYQLKSTSTSGTSSDLTGTVVIGNKPISVFGSHVCANVTPSISYCDHLVEQLPATDTWGKDFITASLAGRTAGDIFRVLASKNGTVVKLNGTTVATLNRGQFYETSLASNSFNQITTTEPCLVAQYSKGSSADNTLSDPFMMIIPPKEQFFGSTVFSTPATGFSRNFVNIVTTSAGVGVIKLDGVTIPAAQFTAIGSSGFSGARITITLGSHSLTAPNIAFGAFVYGYDSDDSYGYPAGQVYAAVATATTLTLTPTTNSVPIGTNNCVTATLTDQNSLPVVGARIDFNTTGANPQVASFGFTNASGQVQLCYTGANLGNDNIVANLGALTASSTVTWISAGVNPPTGVGASPTAICLGSPLSLTASCVLPAVVTWYNVSSGGASIGSNSPFPITPAIAGTLTYFASCKDGANESVRIATNSVSVLNPAVPVATGASIFLGGSVTLNATGCTGVGSALIWFKSLDYSPVTMPVSPITDTQYYAKCQQTVGATVCTSAKSNDVTVTVNPAPVVSVIYVNKVNVNPIQDGLTWATAFSDLQSALLLPPPAGAEIWVAQGTYKPTATINKTITFNIPSGAMLFGGFVGTEIARTQRNFTTNPTILSGEIGSASTVSDNSHHVVIFDAASSVTRLDGFTITAGNANLTAERTRSFDLLAVSIFDGGGIALDNGSSPVIINCRIVNNDAIVGGGLFATNNSNPTVMNCRFMGNQATFGGGAYNLNSNPTYTNVLFSGNKAIGGAMYNNGSSPIVTNATIAGNGGLNGAIFNSVSTPVVKNSVIFGNITPFNDTQSVVTYSIIEGGYPGVGNLNLNPQFVSMTPSGLAPTLSGDNTVINTSPAIDGGDNGAISLTDKDLVNNSRRYNGGIVDMGAYEFQGSRLGGIVISIVSGDWESNSTWNIGRKPLAGDNVILNNNHNVTINSTGTFKNVEIRTNAKLIHNSVSSKLQTGI